MDKDLTPVLSPAEAEAFWRTGEDARTAATGADPETIQHDASELCAAVGDRPHNGSLAALDGRDSAGDAPLSRERAGDDIEESAELKQCGVDVPGVGHVRAVNIPGSVYVEGEVPETLREFLDAAARLGGGDGVAIDLERAMRRVEKRASLLIRLVFAARDLAERNVLGQGGCSAQWCRECQMNKVDDRVEHAAACRVGRVTAILDELHALDGGIAKLEVHNPDKKEAAADGETGRAGDGIRLRGLRLTDAARELRRAALDEIAQISDYTFQCNACGSSVTGLDKSASDILHTAFCWVGNALIVLSSDEIDDEAPVLQQVREARQPLIVANLTAEEFKRFKDAKIPDTASSERDGEFAPYIATEMGQLHAVVRTFGWDHCDLSIAGESVVIKHSHASSKDLAAGAMVDELRKNGGAQ